MLCVFEIVLGQIDADVGQVPFLDLLSELPSQVFADYRGGLSPHNPGVDTRRNLALVGLLTVTRH